MIFTKINIGGTDYDATARASNRFVGIDALKMTTDGYDELEFHVLGCGSRAPFVPGQAVTLSTATTIGGTYTTRFVGDILGPVEYAPVETGWQFNYRCIGLKRRADYITLRSSSGGEVANYNLSLGDADYLYSQAGKTVGQIVTAILIAPINAAALNAAGIGAYTTLGPPAIMPSQTVTDLAALSIVPNADVRLEGESILSILDQFIRDWHAQYCLWVQPNGTIRVASPFAFTAQSLVVPGGTAAITGDPVDWPEYSIDCSDCFTQYQIIGKDIEGVILSQAAGTLTKGWSSGDESAWTESSYTQPQGASDDGVASSVTSVSCTVTSHHAAAHWVANFWNNGGGYINLHWLAGTGIDIHATRQVTSCTALTAGGTATITWDSSDPLPITNYNSYELVGSNTPGALVSRLFHICEPSSGAVDLATYVGSRLEPRFNRYGFTWANMSQLQVYLSPIGKVMWSSTGAWPWFEVPLNVNINPTTGQILFTEPAVNKSASLANQTGALDHGYPTTYFGGLYYDVQVIVPYNKGDLIAYAPLPGAGVGGSNYQGTAYSTYGIQRIKFIPLDTFQWRGDQPMLEQLAAERLKTMCNATVEGSIGMHYDSWTPTFDVFTLGYALNLTIGSTASDIDGLDLPVRTVVIRWPNEGANLHTVSFRFSNRTAPFTGDSRYIHPSVSGIGVGTMSYEVFGGGGGGAWDTTPNYDYGHSDGSGDMSFGDDMGGGGSSRGSSLFKAPDASQQRKQDVEAKAAQARANRSQAANDAKVKAQGRRDYRFVGPPSSLSDANEAPLVGGGAFGGDTGDLDMSGGTIPDLSPPPAPKLSDQRGIDLDKENGG